MSEIKSVISDKLPKIVQKKPYKITVEGGKLYSFCTCGLSAKDPSCDGSHKGTNFRSFKYTSEETKDMYLCGCKHSKNMPFCDGSHKTL